MTNFHIEDFTETHYQELLKVAKARYRFVFYGEEEVEPHVVWRHDVDMSPHRALRLSEIESELGVKATYFFLFHSRFYNLLEKEVIERVRKISRLGHSIGLHFDPAFYEGVILSSEQMSACALQEKHMLEQISGSSVNAISFHNPDFGNLLSIESEKIGGMWNAYSQRMKREYKYCSDSNGYWRFDRLFDVLNSSVHNRLHILTHPEWWTECAVMPSERVQRCIIGRAEACQKIYEKELSEFGRLHVQSSVKARL